MELLVTQSYNLIQLRAWDSGCALLSNTKTICRILCYFELHFIYSQTTNETFFLAASSNSKLGTYI